MAKSKQTPLSGFSREIHLILDDYADDVADRVGQVVERITKSGAKRVQAAARAKFPVPGSRHKSTGAYAKGWKARVDKKGRTVQGVIYNKDLPGLPHLLEHGHANVNGGRTPGYVHIKPVEDALKAEFEKAVKEEL